MSETYTYTPTEGIRADELKMGDKFLSGPDDAQITQTVKSVRIIKAPHGGPSDVYVTVFRRGDIFLFWGNAEVQIFI